MKRMFKDFFADFRVMKHYIIAAVLVFAIGIFVGSTSADLQDLLQSQLEGLKGISNLLSQREHPQFWFFIFIFLNNSFKAILFIFFGALFGIFPLFSLLMNGMILGFISAQSVVHQQNVWEMFLKGILPHGVIELPAIFIASAYGIRLGAIILKGVLRLFTKRRGTTREELIHFFRITPALILVLVGALFVAAIIESTLTYTLMKG